ncbi:uncharacterized protein LOC128735926 [Sabethes cyaneus]|uniref:uncharacterized protein LOC128735926 n=1 Tax=Sabethes cyaneus TaxID=53552 RepID=UPI00237DC568|nr:uncharacterized protein LOC128735926 [Sabethes cyaneus]
MECLVLPKLAVHLPTSTVDISDWRIPEHLPLANPQFNVSHGIDLIIGAELFPFFFQAEQLTLADNLPMFYKTSLGYLIAGTVPTNAVTPTACLVSTLDSLDAQVKKFWQVEDFDQGKALTPDELHCENHFQTTHSRTQSVRYIVRLPIRSEILQKIGDSWPVAARRFTALERRLQTNECLKTSYTQFMNEYEELGHMKEMKTRVALPQFFLPHHANHRPDSTTTKIRVVFDGSCKDSNGIALNDLLFTGQYSQLYYPLLSIFVYTATS